MSTRLKIVSGTHHLYAARLCDTCHSGVVCRGADGGELIYCLLTERELAIRVVECNCYVHRHEPFFWVRRTANTRPGVGFIRAGEMDGKQADEK
jgi:hypothetical protein